MCGDAVGKETLDRPNRDDRLIYIDGMKGICLIGVCVLHFLLQFLPFGFVGWNCPEAGTINPTAYYFQYFPYSVLTNNSFPLYLFVGIAAFIPSYKFFQSGNAENLQKQAVTRYFRLMPMTLVACLISALLFKTNLTPLNDFYEATKNNWIGGCATAYEYSLPNVLADGTLGAYLHGTSAVSSLWCLHYFFYGTLLTGAILLLFGKMKRRGFLYGALVILLWGHPAYLSFLACIVSADIVCHRGENGKKLPYAVMLVGGVIIGLFPPVLLPKQIGVIVLYAVGCLGVVTGTAALFANNKLLCSPWLCRLGQKSFSGIIVHMLVLFSINQHLYMWLSGNGMAPWLNIAINFIVFTVLSIVLTELYDFILTPPTNWLCQKVTAFFNLGKL